MFKRQKWFNLTVSCAYEKHNVPIFRACAGRRNVPLFKTLLSSYCRNDCKFCALRYERRTLRDRWEPIEFAKVAYKLWRMKKIEGVFLSSSVEKDPDSTVEKEIEAIELLRRMGFKKYVHMKMMPGTSRELIKKATEISDRIGINIEMPSKEHYENMKLHLTFIQDIIRRLRWISKEVERVQKEGKCKAGLDSQMIVGASDETDKQIIEVSDKLYRKLNARRVYYSKFDPIENTPLENKKPENPWREYRLYQSSFLIRDYRFEAKDFVFDDNDRLDLKEDPKFSIAKENELVIDINNAEFEELIKIPGIGLKTAQKIIEDRPIKDVSKLKILGVILKKANPFIDMNNIHQTTLSKWIN
jgi:predicted DNA-binding helix-hairpin-helix protein